jgi:hypothetical protein
LCAGAIGRKDLPMRSVTLSGVALVAACVGNITGATGTSTGSGNDDDGGARVDARPGGGTGPDAAPGGGGGGNGTGAYFPAGSWFYTDVSATRPAASSAAILKSLRDGGGWGNGDTFQIDFSIDVLQADASARQAFQTTADFYSPDCDPVPMPMPAGGYIEDETGYACTHNGDCHLLVHVAGEHRLYEMNRANLIGSVLHGGCLAVWDTSRAPATSGRGQQCTSADAAGFPIAPLLFTADEVAAGEIRHAIRFILPNERIKRGYVPPATHGTDTTGDDSAPYYGLHMRLRADYPLASLPSDGARVVARALQRYGMYHADGGEIALTAQSDKHTTAKWRDLLDAHDLSALRIEDFAVLDHGAPIELTYDCTRTPLRN